MIPPDLKEVLRQVVRTSAGGRRNNPSRSPCKRESEERGYVPSAYQKVVTKSDAYMSLNRNPEDAQVDFGLIFGLSTLESGIKSCFRSTSFRLCEETDDFWVGSRGGWSDDVDVWMFFDGKRLVWMVRFSTEWMRRN
jgi:hypothetical protein